MKILIVLICFFSMGTVDSGHENEKISTIDFVQILDDNRKEAVYYYQNNWEVLREKALKKDYIHSFQILETPYSEESPFHLMLITTYKNKQQYDSREEHFGELIEEMGKLSLMNEKQPGEFRKTLFSKEMVSHWY